MCLALTVIYSIKVLMYGRSQDSFMFRYGYGLSLLSVQCVYFVRIPAHFLKA